MKVAAFLLSYPADLSLILCVKITLLRYPDAVRRAMPDRSLVSIMKTIHFWPQ
jgi:hypothetical protein